MNKYKLYIKSEILTRMRIVFLLGAIVSFFFTTGCRDEFMPDLKKYEELLVVDAMITDEQGPYTVKLSRTSEVNNTSLNPYTGCRVRLAENTGAIETLTEVAPGTYQTTGEDISAGVGKSYQLMIETPQGEHYSSDFIEMKPKVDIQNVRAELQFKESIEYPWPLGGYQFFVSSAPTSEDVNLFWRLEETFEYTSDFKIDFYFRGMGIEEYPKPDTVFRCWKSQKVNNFYIESTRALSSSQVTDKPLHFVSTETKRLQVRYSLLVKQFNISDEAYAYWKDIREQIADDDFLFSSQPYQIIGNIKNDDNPEEQVLGFFTVASVTEKRIFADRPQNTAFYYDKCVGNTDLRGLGLLGPDQFPVYLANTPEGIALASEFCFDCTLWGGELARPEFWEDAKSEKNNHKNP